MRNSISTIAFAAALAAATSLAVAAPRSGGGGGMGGMGGLAGGRMAGPSASSAGPQRQATGTNATNNGISRHGQPSQSCQAAANYPADTPGNAFNSPGSAFDPNGKADSKYAGTQPQNSKNPKSVAQYDVACTNQKPK